MKKMILAISILVLLFAAYGCTSQKADHPESSSVQEKPTETVKIAYLPITHALPVFVANEMQSDTDGIHIELVKFGSWPELVDALNTGRVDGASVLIELAMKSKEQGIGLKAVALGHTDGNVVIASKEIAEPSDLQGKTVAIPHRQSSHYLLISQMLQDAGMTIDDVNLVELSPPEMPSALASGQIDGYCVAEPFGAKAVALDAGHVLFESGDLWDHSLCCALVLTDQFINSKKDTAEMFVTACKDAGQYITSNKNLVYEMTKEYLSVDQSVFDISMRWIEFDDLTITKEYYDDLSKRMRDLKLSDSPPEYDDFVDATLY